jgi:hypothetical protein
MINTVSNFYDYISTNSYVLVRRTRRCPGAHALPFTRFRHPWQEIPPLGRRRIPCAGSAGSSVLSDTSARLRLTRIRHGTVSVICANLTGDELQVTPNVARTEGRRFQTRALTNYQNSIIMRPSRGKHQRRLAVTPMSDGKEVARKFAIEGVDPCVQCGSGRAEVIRTISLAVNNCSNHTRGKESNETQRLYID